MALSLLAILVSLAVLFFVIFYLSKVERTMNTLTTSIKDELQRMDSEFKRSVIDTQNTVKGVERSLASLDEKVRYLEELGESIGKLEEILRPPKLRGGMGEVLLEKLVKEVLPEESYRVHYRFRSGEIVDMVLLIGDRILPVDSKFPLDSFERLLTLDEEDKKRELSSFRRSVKARIDEIARKYIKPDEGTYDFALMYIPAEGVYYEAFIKRGDGKDDLYQYAIERRVVPVSPQTFYAYLQVILYGLKGLKVEEEAKKILDFLGTLRGQLDEFERGMNTLGSHIGNAQNKYNEVIRAFNRIKSSVQLFKG